MNKHTLENCGAPHGTCGEHAEKCASAGLCKRGTRADSSTEFLPATGNADALEGKLLAAQCSTLGDEEEAHVRH